jgi:hypothetical protein
MAVRFISYLPWCSSASMMQSALGQAISCAACFRVVLTAWEEGATLCALSKPSPI